MKRLCTSLALLAGLCACAPAPVQRPPLAASADFSAWYRAAATREPVYRIDAARSLIAVTVRRGGPFARFGHDHVVASRSVSGWVAPRSGRADFQFRLDELSVDEAVLRNAAGLDTQPSAEDIAGTRANMLNKVLEADRYPVVNLHAERIAAVPGSLRLAVTLHGVTRVLDVPVRVETGAQALSAEGTLRLLQSEFGIAPMSIMGGALRVEDAMELRFTLVARR